jgi:hypothetical protein
VLVDPREKDEPKSLPDEKESSDEWGVDPAEESNDEGWKEESGELCDGPKDAVPAAVSLLPPPSMAYFITDVGRVTDDRPSAMSKMMVSTNITYQYDELYECRQFVT